MKKHTGVSVFFAGLMALIVLLGVMFAVTTPDNEKESVPYKTAVDFSGSYYGDDLQVKEISGVDDIVSKRHEEIVLTGRFSEEIPDDQFLILSVCDVWIEIEADGKVLAHNRTQHGAKTNTPGMTFLFIPGSEIPDDTDIKITYNNPYAIDYSLTPIEDSMQSLCYGEKDVPYISLLQECSTSIVISLAICFLGLFAFTLAGLLWKKIQLRNLALSFLAIVGGIFALTDTVRMYLPLWVENPVHCLLIDEFTMFLLPVAAFLYIRQFFETQRVKYYMNFLVGGALLLGMLAYLFQIVGFMDILISQYYIMMFVYAGIVGVIVSLVYEGFFRKADSPKKLLATLAPLILASVFDSLNIWLAFAPGKSSLRLGLLITIALQLYFLIVETIRHNKEAAEFEKMQHELLQMRIAIMVSQIQPHFLYNSLTSIAQMCEKDPPQAKKAIIEFADYMRHNMNSLKDEKPVPFEKELSHLKTYLWLEKMRFGDDLNIVFDIGTTDFLIPSLAVQPLVENAVKHGVGMKEDGGTVKISTAEYEDRFEIVVSDDGVGFDSSVPKNDGRSHVGMENVHNRLKTMCNATMDIRSAVGEGTTVTIKVPKEEE